MTYNIHTRKEADETQRELRYTFNSWPGAELVSARNLKDARGTAEVIFEWRDQTVRVTYGQQLGYKHNLRAIYLTLEDLRMTFRRGLGDILTNTVSQMLQLGAGARERDPYEVLGVRPDTDIEIIDAAYRTLAKKRHPDAGGSHEEMAELNRAIERIRTDREEERQRA